MSQGQQLLRLDEEETGTIDPAESKALLDLALDLMADASVIVLSDYGKATIGQFFLLHHHRAGS
jgi:D-beta-D-heptose 7-phosphate kinase/D-beta-D-heptose 1-phosphate adenosyltransferase